MRFSSLLFATAIICIGAAPVLCETAPLGLSPGTAQPPDTSAAPPGESKRDPFDFSDKNKFKSEEQKYIKLDESIKVRVDPLCHGAVVDRVVENSTIYVKAAGSSRVEIYLQPVDSPYCGNTVAEPTLIGRSKDARRNFPVLWTKPESYRYVKVYALAFKQNGQSGRSRSVDLCMSGQRYQPPQAR